MNHIIKAAQFAATYHTGQTRTDGTPYIYHPMRVAGSVTLHHGATEEMVIAAWLHDTIEDCGVTALQIEREFGLKVSELVLELTNPSQLLGMKAKGINRENRKKFDHEHIATISREAKIVKMHDRIDNLNDSPKGDKGWVKKYARESMDLYEVVRDADMTLAAKLINTITNMNKRLL